MDGSNVEHLLTDAGFVDVKSQKIKIEMGDWGSQSSLQKWKVLIVDRDNKKLADAWVNIWSIAMEALAEQMIPFIPNDEERAEFVDRVKAELRNMDYQIYCYMYAITVILLIF